LKIVRKKEETLGGWTIIITIITTIIIISTTTTTTRQNNKDFDIGLLCSIDYKLKSATTTSITRWAPANLPKPLLPAIQQSQSPPNKVPRPAGQKKRVRK
jgi:hypothetical protein